MPSNFVIDHESKNAFGGRWLLLDTNALLDAYRLPAPFYDLANEFAELGCELITTKSIALEFLGGTTDENNLDKKSSFLKLLSINLGKMSIYR